VGTGNTRHTSSPISRRRRSLGPLSPEAGIVATLGVDAANSSYTGNLWIFGFGNAGRSLDGLNGKLRHIRIKRTLSNNKEVRSPGVVVVQTQTLNLGKCQ